MDIRFSGFGGQGIIKSGMLIGKAASLFDNKFATLTQSFGPEARGSACSAQVIVDDDKILYPYMKEPDIIIAMSKEAYNKFEPGLKKDGIMLVDEDLVPQAKARDKVRLYKIPATRIAEDLGRKIVLNVLKNKLPDSTCLNVNFPAIKKEEIAGVKICRQAKGMWMEEFEKRLDPRRGEYFWLTGYFEDRENGSTDTDEWALANNFISIVPVEIDFTAYDKMSYFKDWNYEI